MTSRGGPGTTSTSSPIRLLPTPCGSSTNSLWRSIDGGKTFEEISAPHGDHHDLWIDPRDPLRMIEGADGAACVSFNGGDTWSTLYNQLTAQFYRLDTDNRFPYNIYATQQDNTAIMVPSAADDIAINWGRLPVGGQLGERAHRGAPREPRTSYSPAPSAARPGGGGVLLRHDRSTGQTRIVTVWPEDYSGVRRQGHEAPLPVDLPDPVLAARPQHALFGRRAGLQVDRRRAVAGRR